MGSEQLYLRKGKDSYEFIVQEFDSERIPIQEEFMFKEVAVVILYPDGKIDAMPIVDGVNWHLEYCKNLVTKSPRFAEVSKYFPDGWRGEYNMTKSNMVMNRMGIVVIHNIDILNLPDEYEDREEFYSNFVIYGTSDITEPLQNNLDAIFVNYPDKRCTYSKFNNKKNDYDDEETIRKR